MKNFEVFNKAVVVKNIPLAFEGRELPSKLQAKLMLMRVSYEKFSASFNEKLQDVLKGLKAEGFDELAQKIREMESIEKNENATPEEIEKAQQIRHADYDNYKKQEKELLEKYQEAYNQELNEESGFNEKKFSEEELAEIIDMIKTDGEIDFVGGDGNAVKIKKMELIGLIASVFVED